MLFMTPCIPDGVDPSAHVRGLIAAERSAAFDLITGLHLNVHECMRDEAADASTALRELRNVAKRAVDEQLDDHDALLALLAAFTRAVEEADRVLHCADLRFALADDVELWERVASHALPIGVWAMSGLSQFLQQSLRDVGLLQRVEDQASVPLVHALMRAITAGVMYGRACPLEREWLTSDLDELLVKSLDAFGAPPTNPINPLLVQLRNAAISATALWNLARIAQRDNMSASQRNAYGHARSKLLEPIRADVGFQLRQLGVLPNFAFWFDVGVAFSTVDPVLQQLIDEQDVRISARPNPMIWMGLLDGA